MTFLDNHDQHQHQRIRHPDTPPEQVTLALGLLFTLQGVPCVYYGTEQGLQGTVDPAGNADLNALESAREALWGKTPAAFDPGHPVYGAIQALAQLRRNEPPLAYGRLYFREVSGNGLDFGDAFGRGGVVAFSRILVDREVLVVANTGSAGFSGSLLMDLDLNSPPREMRVAFSNLSTTGKGTVSVVPGARFHRDSEVTTGRAAALPVVLRGSEVQVLVPA